MRTSKFVRTLSALLMLLALVLPAAPAAAASSINGTTNVALTAIDSGSSMTPALERDTSLTRAISESTNGLAPSGYYDTEVGQTATRADEAFLGNQSANDSASVASLSDTSINQLTFGYATMPTAPSVLGLPATGPVRPEGVINKPITSTYSHSDGSAIVTESFGIRIQPGQTVTINGTTVTNTDVQSTVAQMQWYEPLVASSWTGSNVPASTAPTIGANTPSDAFTVPYIASTSSWSMTPDFGAIPISFAVSNYTLNAPYGARISDPTAPVTLGSAGSSNNNDLSIAALPEQSFNRNVAGNYGISQVVVNSSIGSFPGGALFGDQTSSPPAGSSMGLRLDVSATNGLPMLGSYDPAVIPTRNQFEVLYPTGSTTPNDGSTLSFVVYDAIGTALPGFNGDNSVFSGSLIDPSTTITLTSAFGPAFVDNISADLPDMTTTANLNATFNSSAPIAITGFLDLSTTPIGQTIEYTGGAITANNPATGNLAPTGFLPEQPVAYYGGSYALAP